MIEIEDVSEPFNGCRRKNMVLLLDKEPEIASEWHYAKNCGWGPEHFSHSSDTRVWWECRFCMRTYKSTIHSRTSQYSSCPYCASHRVCEDNALVVFHPEVAAEWHPTKNGKKKAEELTRASSKNAWWKCSKCSHSWQTKILCRTLMESGCPACYQAKMEYARLQPNRHPTPPIILDDKSEPSQEWYERRNNGNFVSLYQHSKKLAKEWHPTKNGKITPRDIPKSSHAIVWWKCLKGTDHEWQTPVANRGRGGSGKSGCPFCRNLQLSVTNCLAEKAPEIAKEWHPTKNGKLTSKDVVAGGRDKYWWKCQRDKDHEWQANIYGRIDGEGCPYCSHKRVSKDNCLNKEFAYLAAQLHPTKNGNLTGDAIAAQSSKKIWWKCEKGPDHEWLATPANRTGRGSGCPACYNKQLSVTNCLATTSPETAKQWNKKRNGKLTPKMVLPSSEQVVWWVCRKGHSWQQMIRKRVISPVECRECKWKSKPGKSAKR